MTARRWVLVVALVVAPVVYAQAPAPPRAPVTLAAALEEAQRNFARRNAALLASDVYRDYDEARKHVETLAALVAADAKAKSDASGSK